MTPVYNHILNLGLRGLTIVLRFGLFFVLGKFLATDQLGVFGLFNTTITITIFFLGFDYYAFAHREILKSSPDLQLDHLKNSGVFFGFTYLVFLPLCLAVFFVDVLPLSSILWFYIILVLEHISQELYRLLVLFEKQILANVALFLRTASWIAPLIAYWSLSSLINVDLASIFISWTFGSFISIVFGLACLKKHYRGHSGTGSVNWNWIKTGIPISIKFLLGTIAYKIIEFSDRYFLNFYTDKKTVGVYTFYYGIANVLQVFVFTVVIGQLYPKLTEYYLKGELTQFAIYKKKFAKEIILASLVGSVLIVVGIFPVLWIIEKPEFFENYSVYVLIVAAVAVLNISFIPHYILYAMGKDNIIVTSTVICAIVNVVCNVFLTSHFGLTGSAISTLISYSILLAIKFYYTYDKT